MYSSTPKVLHTRLYAKHWAVHTSVFTTASDCKARWYLVRIPTSIVATNTSGHSHIPVPRQPRNEWINWRKPVSAANSRDTIAVASSSSATLPKRKPSLKKNDRRWSLHIKRGRQNRFLLLQHIILLSKKMFDTPQSPLVRQNIAIMFQI